MRRTLPCQDDRPCPRGIFASPKMMDKPVSRSSSAMHLDYILVYILQSLAGEERPVDPQRPSLTRTRHTRVHNDALLHCHRRVPHFRARARALPPSSQRRNHRLQRQHLQRRRRAERPLRRLVPPVRRPPLLPRTPLRRPPSLHADIGWNRSTAGRATTA